MTRQLPLKPAFLYVALTIITFFLLLPVFWMVSTSLKTLGSEFDLPIEWIPSDPRWENYAEAWSNPLTRSDFARYTLNSVIVTGTPSGVGHARKPPLWMKHGDVCEIEIEGIGILSNPIQDEKKS